METKKETLRELPSSRCVTRLLVTSLVMAPVLVVAIAHLAAKFPVNHSTSMPMGIYRLVSKPVARGTIVGACLPSAYAKLARERGYLSFGICPRGVRPVMKFVAAIPGDSVSVDASGVSVNDAVIENTIPLRTDSLGRLLPQQYGPHRVGTGEYWLISNHDPGSFDSRYFGPVTDVLGVVEPLLIDGDATHLNPINKTQRVGASLP